MDLINHELIDTCGVLDAIRRKLYQHRSTLLENEQRQCENSLLYKQQMNAYQNALNELYRARTDTLGLRVHLDQANQRIQDLEGSLKDCSSHLEQVHQHQKSQLEDQIKLQEKEILDLKEAHQKELDNVTREHSSYILESSIDTTVANERVAELEGQTSIKNETENASQSDVQTSEASEGSVQEQGIACRRGRKRKL